MAAPDPKREKRIRNPGLLRALHWEFDECVICGRINISIHHVLPRSQGGDDVEENLVPLCGDGVSGCHGGVEHAVDAVAYGLGRYLLRHRPDTLKYLEGRLGSPEAVGEFFQRRYRIAY